MSAPSQPDSSEASVASIVSVSSNLLTLTKGAATRTDRTECKVGSFKGRTVRLGEHSERITKITARRTPVIRFHDKTRVDIAPKHALSDAAAPFKTLATPGPLNLKRFLAELYST